MAGRFLELHISSSITRAGELIEVKGADQRLSGFSGGRDWGMRIRGLRHSDDDLIDLIYAALLGEASWQQFLDRLSENAPDGRTILFSMNTREPDDYVGMTSKFDLPELESYAAHYINTNPWLEHCALRQVGLGVFSDQIVPRKQLVKTEFFNDWLSPNNISTSIGVTIDKNEGSPLIVSTVTSRGDPDENSVFSDQLTRIAPHLRRAASFYKNSSVRWAAFDLNTSLFDFVETGVVIIGENAQIKTISPIGQELLDKGTLISVSPLGKLRLRGKDAQTALNTMLKRSYTGPRTASFLLQGIKLTLVAMEKERLSLYFEGPTVALLIQPSGAPGEIPGIDQFAEFHRLTMGERRALLGVINGRTITQIALEASVSRETIRTQLKSLYAKTGTRSQNDLLRLAYRMANPGP
ncbi:helix-turn-helix transcriptional regulator [Agrobacterium tumefaciens]|uniref:Helix-turn-helix transcriptional regulator n=1 Tax=Agrobacterium tumefaciens TaxID=358 RepID=A0A546Y1U9_AGRTU|nr:LuxR C-terminal-related transcriptional regulator [Agrobacterium tumefaciens]TRB06981.1 helix-turn-helix transcriptional regulator [Agrobacterium tumefaciens]